MTEEKLLYKVNAMLGERFPGLSPTEILEHVTGVPLDPAVCAATEALIQYLRVMAELLWSDDLRAFVNDLDSTPPLPPPHRPPGETAWRRLMTCDDE
jgi:hypothetical protein